MWDEYSDRRTFPKCPVSEVDRQFLVCCSLCPYSPKTSAELSSLNVTCKDPRALSTRPSRLLPFPAVSILSQRQLTLMPTLRLLYSRTLRKMKLRPTASCLEDFFCGHVCAAQHCTIQQHLQNPWIIQLWSIGQPGASPRLIGPATKQDELPQAQCQAAALCVLS